MYIYFFCSHTPTAVATSSHGGYPAKQETLHPNAMRQGCELCRGADRCEATCARRVCMQIKVVRPFTMHTLPGKAIGSIGNTGSNELTDNNWGQIGVMVFDRIVN